MTGMPACRRLVDLCPRFLSHRRAGWTGLQMILNEAGLKRREFFLLRALVEETDPGASLTYAAAFNNLFNPYATVRPILASLPALVERGYLTQTRNTYTVAPEGRALNERVEQAAQAYIASLDLLPAAELAQLAAILANIAARCGRQPSRQAKPTSRALGASRLATTARRWYVWRRQFMHSGRHATMPI